MNMLKLFFLMLLSISFTACQSAQLKVKDVPLPKNTEQFDLWRNKNQSDLYNDFIKDEYVQADKRILNYLKPDSGNYDSDIFLLDKSVTVQAINAFYDEEFARQGFQLSSNSQIGVSNITLLTWEKKQWFEKQMVAVALLDIAHDSKQNLLMIYTLRNKH